MKNIIAVNLFLLMEVYLHSQNLVPNPSFETITTCSLNMGGSGGVKAGYVPPWDSPTDGSPDLYNICAINIPNNNYGHQYPHTGNGYVGASYYNYGTFWEYIQVKLDSNLAANETYCVSFFVSLADTMKFACNNFGIYFSNNPIHITGVAQLHLTPQINHTAIVSDKENWKIIYGQYTATGSERYIVIGNFFSNALTDTIHSNGSIFAAYYYIDDVNVHCCSCDSTSAGVNEIGMEKAEEIKVYPNPATNSLTLALSTGEGMQSVKIYNVMGECVWASSPLLPSRRGAGGEVNIDVSKLQRGLYVVEVQTEKGTIRKKFVKE